MAVEKFIFGHGLKLAEFAHINFCACCTFFVPCVCMGNSSLNPKMILLGLTVIETYEKEIQSGRMSFWQVEDARDRDFCGGTCHVSSLKLRNF